MSISYKTSPLPFQGQKRNFIKEFKNSLKKYPNDAIYVDLFGGSGLLSHTVKQEKPLAKVIYNDYDNFKKRLDSIPETNTILEELRTILIGYPKGKKLEEEIRKKVLCCIRKYDQIGFVDYVSLSSSILFSMKYVNNYNELEKETLYNNLRKSNFKAEGYLDNVEFVCKDYKVLFEEYKNKNVVFLVDPPYLSTDSKTYKNYWRLKDYLDVLKVLKDTRYFYFTSNKSSIVELCEWIEDNTGGENPFNGATIKYQYTKTTHSTGYTDIMLHKRWTTSHT